MFNNFPAAIDNEYFKEFMRAYFEGLKQPSIITAAMLLRHFPEPTYVFGTPGF